MGLRRLRRECGRGARLSASQASRLVGYASGPYRSVATRRARNDSVIQTNPPAAATIDRLNTVSLRLRVTPPCWRSSLRMLICSASRIERNLHRPVQSEPRCSAHWSGAACASAGTVRLRAPADRNQVQAGGVQAHLVLPNGTEFGTPITSSTVKTTTITLNAPTRVDGASLTLPLMAPRSSPTHGARCVGY